MALAPLLLLKTSNNVQKLFRRSCSFRCV